MAALHAATRGSVLSYSVLRMQGAPQMLDIAVEQFPSGAARPVFRPRGRRHLHAAGGRRRAPPPARQSGHAAFLLVERRVLRDAGVLVQRPARSPRLGLLLGRTRIAVCCCRRCSCTSRWCSPSVRDSWVRSDAGRAACCRCCTCRRLLLGAAVAAVAARRLPGRGARRTSPSSLERGELLYLAVSLVGGLGDHDPRAAARRSVTARRQLRWIVWGTALGAIPFVLGYALPFTLGFTPSQPHSSSPRCCSGWCRWPSRRQSSATA